MGRSHREDRPSARWNESRHRDVIESIEKAPRQSLELLEKLGEPLKKKNFFADAGVATLVLHVFTMVAGIGEFDKKISDG